MKIIYVTGDDYAALSFEKDYKDMLVVNFIKEYFTENINLIELNLTQGNKVTIELLEFGEIDERFIHFILKYFINYDQSKHEKFYTENQTIN